MKPFKRQPLYALCLAALCSTNASALGVGTARVLSPLGTPLRALIPVEHADGLSANEIKAGLASDANYQRMGVQHDWAQGRLQFRPVFRDGKPYIEVTTDTPVSEPYVDFVLSLRWPNGQIAREYALLLDPPGTATPAPTAQAPNTTAPSYATAVTTRAGAPIKPGNRYTTRRGDSLWRIAERVSGDHPIGATMDAIYQANPQAFINGDRNRLKAGVRLRVPASTTIAQASPAPASTRVIQPKQTTASTRAVRVSPPPSAQVNAKEATPGKAAGDAPTGPSRELAGLQQGITRVTSDQAATRAKIAALESELNGMIARYKALAAQTQTLQRQLDRARQAVPTPAAAAVPAVVATDDRTTGLSTPWWVHAIYLGVIGALVAWLGRERLVTLGRRITPKRSPRPATAGFSAMPTNMADLDDAALVAVPVGHTSDPFEQDQAVDPTLLAGAHVAFGQLDEARSVLEEAIASRPNDTALQLQLLDVYAEAGDRDAFEQLAAQLGSGRLGQSEQREIDHLRSRLGGDAEPANVTDLHAKRRKNAS